MENKLCEWLQKLLGKEKLPEFREYHKIPRLYREIQISEKIDGTNAQIYITKDQKIYAGSRTKWLTPGKHTDNFGFAQWVFDHKKELLKLGSGRHFGEWFGKGIQRGYDLQERRFYLFDTIKWGKENILNLPSCVGVVPVLCEGLFTDNIISQCLSELKIKGSRITEGFMKPEGIVIYHIASGKRFKVTLEGDSKENREGSKNETAKTCK